MSRRCRPRRSRPGTSGCRPAGPRCRGRTWPVNDMKSSPCANATANVHGRQLARLHLNPRPLCAVSGIRLGGACGAAARRQRRPAALGRPRPSHAGPHLRSPQIKAAHTACIGAPRGRLPRHPSVQLAVAASRAPFGRRQGRSAFADPGPGTPTRIGSAPARMTGKSRMALNRACAAGVCRGGGTAAGCPLAGGPVPRSFTRLLGCDCRPGLWIDGDSYSREHRVGRRVLHLHGEVEGARLGWRSGQDVVEVGGG